MKARIKRDSSRSTESFTRRRKLLSEVERLAEVAVFRTLSETYRTCGSQVGHRVEKRQCP
jgi:hypothetical protein